MGYDNVKIGERIVSLRKSHGMTQEQLADKLQISTNYMQKIERARCGCPIDVVVNVAELFEVSTDYILLGANEAQEKQKNRIEAIANALKEMADKM